MHSYACKSEPACVITIIILVNESNKRKLLNFIKTISCLFMNLYLFLFFSIQLSIIVKPNNTLLVT